MKSRNQKNQSTQEVQVKVQNLAAVRTQHLLVAVGIASILSACDFIDSKDAVETVVGTPTSQPADFTVQTETTSPEASTQSPDQNAGQTTGGETIGTSPTASSSQPILAGLTIKQGARTASKNVDVTIHYFDPQVFMKLGYSNDCSDGTWSDYAPSKVVALPLENQKNNISVQFMDYDGAKTPCYRQSIIHDNVGPEILFQKYPTASLEEGASGEITVQVSDIGSAVGQVTCRLNELNRPCAGGVSQVAISAMPKGNYEFSVQAVDELGNASTASVKWSVISTTRHMTQDIRVEDYRKVDVVFVIDNSGSMAYEQRSMASRTSNFISILNGLDWQIGVTTTDPSNRTLGDGQLIPLTGVSNQYILDSKMPMAQAQDILGQTLQRRETGSASEQGIRSIYRLIERYSASQSHPQSLLRAGSQLAVVLISDEDESANTVKNDPQKLVDLVQSTFGGQKSFSFHSIVTRPGDTACKSTHGAVYGHRYKAMSELTGGLLGSVCEMDYAVQVQGIAEKVRNLLKTLTLSCAPVAGSQVSVYKDGVVSNLSFQVQGLNVVFDSQLLPGDYQLKYRCLN